MHKIILKMVSENDKFEPVTNIRFEVDSDGLQLNDLCDVFTRFVKAVGYFPKGPVMIGEEEDYK